MSVCSTAHSTARIRCGGPIGSIGRATARSTVVTAGRVRRPNDDVTIPDLTPKLTVLDSAPLLAYHARLTTRTLLDAGIDVRANALVAAGLKVVA